MIPVLAVATRPGPGLRSLFRHLSGTGLFELRVAGPEALTALNGTRVVLGATDRRLRPEQAESLAGWLRSGGGLVTLGGTAAAWAEHPELGGLLGTPPLDPSAPAELLVRPVPGHPITDRLEPEIPIEDRLPLAGGLFVGAEAALHAVEDDLFRLGGGGVDAFGLGGGEGGRALADDVLAGAQRGDRGRRVQVIRQADADGVELLVGDELLPRRIFARDLELVHHLAAARRDQVRNGTEAKAAGRLVAARVRLPGPATADNSYPDSVRSHPNPFRRDQPCRGRNPARPDRGVLCISRPR